MILRRLERFKKSYSKLTDEEKERAKKALSLLSENMNHPGLRVKKIKGTKGIFEARVSRAIRMTFQVEKDVCVLRVIGRHDEVLRSP